MFSLFKYQRNRWFWKLRYYVNAIIFHLNKTYFHQKEKIKRAKEGFSITEELVKIIAPSLLTAFLIVIVLEVVENTLLTFISISKPIFIKDFLNYLAILYNRLIISVNSLETLFSIVASISGIFLGLYFTAISVVASSVFARVPSNLRELLLKEKVGNQYIKILAILTSVCIILLGYRAFGGYPGIFTSLFVVILGCFGIFCFVVLGLRAFFFFDPTRLGDAIFYELNNNIRLSTIRGFRWADPNFQSHYQKLAAKNISTLGTLIKLCTEEPQLQKQPLSSILQKSIYFLMSYAEQRSFIPSDSRWYALMPRYKSWFFYDSSALTIALQTKTSIQPEMVPNPYWLEDDVIEILSPAFEKALQKENLEVVYETLNSLNVYLEKLGANLEFKKGREIISQLSKPIEEYYNTHTFIDIKDGPKDIELALFDAYGLTIMSLALGFFKLIRNSNMQDILKKIDVIKWLGNKNIYENGIAPPVLPRIEYIQKRLKFEKRVENKIISPNWYIRQLIIMRYLELFQETVNELLSSVEDFFISKSDSFISKKSFILAAHHSQRGLKMCNKIRAHFPSLKKLIEEFEKIRVNKDLPWPQWDWNQIKDRIDKYHDKLVENVAKCIPTLSLVEHKENFPDLFGQTYNTVCQDCYESMLLKNPKKFKNLFPLLFVGSLVAHEKLRKKVKGWPPETGLAISLEPLLDIMELSGYAKLYSELFDISEIWDVCKTTWDKYFDSHDQPGNGLRFLIELYKYRKSLFQIFPRDILRTNWQINFNNKLREMNLIGDMFSSSYPWNKDVKIKHKSSIIRAICRGRYEPHVSATEIFIIIYLMKRPESKGVEFKDMWGLSKLINQEENSREGDIDV